MMWSWLRLVFDYGISLSQAAQVATKIAHFGEDCFWLGRGDRTPGMGVI
jgi:hypothetical protein